MDEQGRREDSHDEVTIPEARDNWRDGDNWRDVPVLVLYEYSKNS